jgi:hypothetical protein
MATSIIEVNITRETQGVSRQGFGTPLFLGTTAEGWSAGERVRTYTGIDEVLADFPAESAEYTAAQRYFGQEVSPTFIKIGRQILGVASVTGEVTVADAEAFDITMGGLTASYTSGTGATAQSIVIGLLNAFNAEGLDGVFEDNGDGTFTILPNNTETASVSGTPNMTLVENTEGLTDALTAISNEDDDWYFLSTSAHDAESMLEAAGYIQAKQRMYITSYSGIDAYSASATTDPGFRLQELNFDRTAIIYTKDSSEFPECAVVGLQGPKDPGSTTWKFKEVSGVTPAGINTTQSIVLKGTKYDYGKGYNTFEPKGGRVIFAEGRTVSGEFIDVIRFSHWIAARMVERTFMTLVNSEKIPYTPAGFSIIEGRMREVLNEGVAIGGLFSYTVTVPNPRNIDPNSRANRVATGFKFKGILAGAVHAIEISGSLEI